MNRRSENPGLASDFLRALGVPHTDAYTAKRFADMPFQSAFGLKNLLKEYGVDSDGWLLADKSDITSLTPPFLADTPSGFVIVTSLQPGGSITYLTQGESETMAVSEFVKAFNGMVMTATATADSCEPDYAAHRRMELIGQAKKWCLLAGVTALFLYLFISNGIWRHWSTILLTLFDLTGLTFTYMLVQKSLKIKNRAADRVCGVLQEGGCDHILETKASTFFGIFSWSEVGFSYFSVSLLCLLIFPQCLPWLAAANVLCLPFTVWSIWYQRFRAHYWCTLCVSVQSTLWLLFFCYLGGGWLSHIFPLRIEFFVLCATYGTVLLALNRILPYFHPEGRDAASAPSDDSSTSDPVNH